MYLNSKQKKGLIYLATAGALLIGHNHKVFTIKNGLLRYYLSKIDQIFLNLSKNLTMKDRKQIQRMINNAECDNTDDIIYNLIQCWICLDWVRENAFRTNNQIVNLINTAIGLIKHELLKLEKQNNVNLCEYLIKFLEVEL